jgi:tricarballylate dehydrogenase
MKYDTIVVGAGNAALNAALAARVNGARTLVLEAAPKSFRGGNSHFTGGGFRFPYKDINDIKAVVPDLTDQELEKIDFGVYSEENLYEEIARITSYQADPEMLLCFVQNALPTAKWLVQNGVRFNLSIARHALKIGDRYKFPTAHRIVGVSGAGAGLVDYLFAAAEKNNIEIWYDARAIKLLTDEKTGDIRGVRVRRNGVHVDIEAPTVVLAAGGFEANPEMRAKYLGPQWDVVKVRGTPYNMGDGIKMALEVGAQPRGNWSGCHACAWEANAPESGDRKIGDLFSRHSYHYGICVNQDCERFIDEGADFKTRTYAKYGKEILKQPGRVAYQIFDQKTIHLMREAYDLALVTKAEANTIEELAEAFELSPEALAKTVRDYNAAVQEGTYDPSIRDGKGTVGISPRKTNWALKIDKPPYLMYKVTVGITFTFGGVRINTNSEVLSQEGSPIRGLYAAGEMVGGFWYDNYIGGSGLMAGAVFGRIAGMSAAKYVQERTN